MATFAPSHLLQPFKSGSERGPWLTNTNSPDFVSQTRSVRGHTASCVCALSVINASNFSVSGLQCGCVWGVKGR